MPVRVTVVGSGYVGTVVAACLAHVGHDVVGMEADTSKMEQLARGRSPFYEPELEPLLRASVAHTRLIVFGWFR